MKDSCTLRLYGKTHQKGGTSMHDILVTQGQKDKLDNRKEGQEVKVQLSKRLVNYNRKEGYLNGGSIYKEKEEGAITEIKLGGDIEDTPEEVKGVLSNLDIEEMLEDLKDFKGVFAKDSLPKDSKGHIPIGRYVINLDDSDGPGTHWTALIVRPLNQHHLYFDSFAIGPPDEVRKALRTNEKKNILFSTSQVQNINSEACGWFVVDFLQSVKNDDTFYRFIYKFHQGGERKNDDKITTK
eukprot:Lithocolla_globosa_v1_NODE_7547_length_932_cov_58.672748.p1 type:complete len:239 gc:universal NODE_7547_length_932_cov_58.672748:3-719(+)